MCLISTIILQKIFVSYHLLNIIFVPNICIWHFSFTFRITLILSNCIVISYFGINQTVFVEYVLPKATCRPASVYLLHTVCTFPSANTIVMSIECRPLAEHVRLIISYLRFKMPIDWNVFMFHKRIHLFDIICLTYFHTPGSPCHWKVCREYSFRLLPVCIQLK